MFDEFGRNGGHVQSLVCSKPVTASERVVIISSFSAFNPEHINGRNNTQVFGLLHGQ